MDTFKCASWPLKVETNFETLKMEPERDLNIREEIVQVLTHLAVIIQRFCRTVEGENIYAVNMLFICVWIVYILHFQTEILP